MNRQKARDLARELFPMNLYGSDYRSYEELRRKDTIAADDLLDHIQYSEPMNQDSIKEYRKN